MADTRSPEVVHAVTIDRTAESATAVLRDWDVHVTTILDDQGEVRVRAHDPRTLDAGVTMLRGNAHRALAARHYMPPPVRSSAETLPPRRRQQFAVVGAFVAVLATGGIVFRLLPPPGPSRVQVVVMPAPAETVTVSAPQSLAPPVARQNGEAEAKPAQGLAVSAPSTSPTTSRSYATPARPGSPMRSNTRSTIPSTVWRPASEATPSDGGPTSQPTSSPRPSGPPTSVRIVTGSSSSPPGTGPWSCGSSASWTSSGCTPGSSPS